MPDADYLTPAQVAERLHVSVLTVRRWIGSGRLSATKAGPRRWLVRGSDLDRFLAGTGEVGSPLDEPSEDPSFSKHLLEPHER